MPEQCARLIDELIELRKARGWTQQDLAKACGLTQSVVARIESKEKRSHTGNAAKDRFGIGCNPVCQ